MTYLLPLTRCVNMVPNQCAQADACTLRSLIQVFDNETIPNLMDG